LEEVIEEEEFKRNKAKKNFNKTA